MKKGRKSARDKIKSIKTKSELISYLDSLTITKEEEQIAIEMFVYGYSHTQIANLHGMSIETSKRVIQKVLDKVF